MDTIAKSKLSPIANKNGTEVVVKQFRLTDIPDVMDILNWSQAARIMRRWIDGAPYEITSDIKRGDILPSTLPKYATLEDLPFEWLFSGTTRVKPIIDNLKKELSLIRDYDGTVGRLPGTAVKISPGLKNFISKLERLGVANEHQKIISSSTYDFSNYSAIQLDEASQINRLIIGVGYWAQATDELDDVYGALGGFAIKIAATKFSTIHTPGLCSKIRIAEIGLYVRDTYDFLNTQDDQLLGYWGLKGVIRPGPIDYLTNPDFIDKDGERYFRVTNNSFNNYRKTLKKGGDLVIFSSVYRFPVDIEINLQ